MWKAECILENLLCIFQSYLLKNVFCWICAYEWSSTRGSFPHQGGHLAYLKDVCRSHNCHLVSKGQGCCKTLCDAQDSLPQNRITWPQISIVPRLRDPGIEYLGCVSWHYVLFHPIENSAHNNTRMTTSGLWIYDPFALSIQHLLFLRVSSQGADHQLEWETLAHVTYGSKSSVWWKGIWCFPY